MEKKYLSKIIANDNEGLQMISACCAGAEIKVSDIKYCLLYTSPSPRDAHESRMPSSA